MFLERAKPIPTLEHLHSHYLKLLPRHQSWLLFFIEVGTFLVAHLVKNLLANAGDGKRCRFGPWVRKIPWRKEGVATPSIILAWKIPCTEELDRLLFMGLQTVRHN